MVSGIWHGLAIFFLLLVIMPTWIKGKFRAKGFNDYDLDFSCNFALGLLGFDWIANTTGKSVTLRIARLAIASFSIQSKEKLPESQHTPSRSVKHRWKSLWSRREKVRQGLAILKHSFFFERMAFWLKIGFDDPATTGEVYGYLCNLYACSSKRVRISLEANFFEPCFEAAFMGQVYFIPLYLICCLGIALRRVCWDDQGPLFLKARSVP